MSRRGSAEEYEGGDGIFARWRDKLFKDDDVDDEEEEDFGAPTPAATPKTTPRGKSGSGGSAPGTVLQVHAARGSQITKRVPRSLADAQRAAEDLKERRPVIVNLERADDELARRVIDFISGVTYALNGYYERVGDKVFLFTPSNIIIADEDEVEPGGKGLFADAEVD